MFTPLKWTSNETGLEVLEGFDKYEADDIRTACHRLSRMLDWHNDPYSGGGQDKETIAAIEWQLKVRRNRLSQIDGIQY